MSNLANFVGTHLLPFTNPRVVCPPGQVKSQGYRNLIVATPMRSGTHILIDLILNNLPAYRNRPLYVDLDKCVEQSHSERDLLAPIKPSLGYILKTHMPVNTPSDMPEDPRLAKLLESGCVLTIRRDRAEVCRSLGRWHGIDRVTADTTYGSDYDKFWAYWVGRPQIAIEFTDLFRPEHMQFFMRDLANRTNTNCSNHYVGPPDRKAKRRIYLNKALTRVLGYRAPQIDTTIHTLKT